MDQLKMQLWRGFGIRDSCWWAGSAGLSWSETLTLAVLFLTLAVLACSLSLWRFPPGWLAKHCIQQMFENVAWTFSSVKRSATVPKRLMPSATHRKITKKLRATGITSHLFWSVIFPSCCSRQGPPLWNLGKFDHFGPLPTKLNVIWLKKVVPNHPFPYLGKVKESWQLFP